jgi:hypothetical protein
MQIFNSVCRTNLHVAMTTKEEIEMYRLAFRGAS